MLRSRVYCLLILVGGCSTVLAHDIITTKVTWSREISRLVYQRCAGCHREGGSAFSLMTYQEARPWAKAIKEETLERRMPPWGAVKGFGSFQNDQGLTQEDLELISNWVEGGSPEGDPALLPKPPDRKTAGPPAVQAAAEVMVDGKRTLQAAVILVGLRARTLLEGKSMQVIAELPDGVVDPLIWIYRYNPKFDHPWYLSKPLILPAGTRIVCYPQNAGTVSLLELPVAVLRSGR
jgi:hypothetical protein